MTDSPSLTGYDDSGTYSTITGKYVPQAKFSGATTTITFSGSSVPVGGTITWNDNSEHDSGTYEGYYVHNGVDDPLILISGTYFLLGDSQGLASYTIVAQTYLCFVGGTCILTDRGNVPVEALAVGDLVVTASGALKSIIGVSCRHVDVRAHPKLDKVWPIRVAAHAFGEAQPSRDLFLSPDHAVFVDDVLIPIKELVNGVSIVQVPLERWAYYHIELAQHDVILAEGLPCESFLDAGNRTGFAHGATVTALHPHVGAWSWERACAPLVVYGPRLAAVRSKLAARALGGARLAA